MSELTQLKNRIDTSTFTGVLTSEIRDDYEPAGDMMINNLVVSGEYISRRAPAHDFNSKWRLFKLGCEPY